MPFGNVGKPTAGMEISGRANNGALGGSMFLSGDTEGAVATALPKAVPKGGVFPSVGVTPEMIWMTSQMVLTFSSLGVASLTVTVSEALALLNPASFNACVNTPSNKSDKKTEVRIVQ